MQILIICEKNVHDKFKTWLNSPLHREMRCRVIGVLFGGGAAPGMTGVVNSEGIFFF
jgi:hypothetical protein